MATTTSKRTNLQDKFLNYCRKNRIEVTIFTNNGVPMKGRVISFDDFTIFIDDGKQQRLVYKSAMSTFIPAERVEINSTESDKQ